MNRLLLFFCVVSFNFALGQCIIPSTQPALTSQAEVNAFIAQYSGCTQLSGSITIEENVDTPITSLVGLENLTKITGNLTIRNTSLQNLAGLDNLINVGLTLRLEKNDITDISALAGITKVGKLVLYDNPITSLAPLNSITSMQGDLVIWDHDLLAQFDLVLNVTTVENLSLSLGANCTHIDGLQSLTTVNWNADIGGTAIANLTGLQNLEYVGNNLILFDNLDITTLEPLSSLTYVGRELGVHAENVTTLNGLGNLQHLGRLALQSESISDLSALSVLTSMDGFSIMNCPQLTNLNGFQNLTTVNDVYFWGNTALTDISALENIAVPSSLLMKYNTALAVCEYPFVCEFIVEGLTPYTYIEGNAAGCDTVSEITYHCNNENVNSISGAVTFNYDNAGCNDTQFAVGDLLVQATAATGELYSTLTRENGTYRIVVPEGNYTVEVFTSIAAFQAPSQAVSFENVGNDETMDFCISASVVIKDLKISLYPIALARPGFEATYKVLCENIGTTTESGTITYTYNSEKLDFEYATQSLQITDGLLTWTFENLKPFDEISYMVYFTVIAPPVNEIGQIINTQVTVNNENGDDITSNNTFNLNQELVGSYDPNDKTVREGEQVDIQKADDYLNYKIRFQNTGTFFAENIRLEDQLDEKLDWSTFEPVATSHNGYRVIMNNGFLQVYFDGIRLPAQINDDAGSNGFFAYRVKPKADIAIGDVVENTASIFFDFNTPIITNTVSTEFVEILSVKDNEVYALSLYPNPADTTVNLKADATIIAVTLFNSIGQEVLSLKNSEGVNNINVSDITAGIYLFLVTDTEGNTSAKKVIIK